MVRKNGKKFRKKPCTDRLPHAVHEIVAANVVFIVVVGAAAFGRTPADLNLFSLSPYHTLLHYFSFTLSPSLAICLSVSVSPSVTLLCCLLIFYTFFRLSAHSVSLILEMYLITSSANARKLPWSRWRAPATGIRENDINIEANRTRRRETRLPKIDFNTRERSSCRYTRDNTQKEINCVFFLTNDGTCRLKKISLHSLCNNGGFLSKFDRRKVDSVRSYIPAGGDYDRIAPMAHL